MSKLLYCPNCKKDVPTGKVPDATVVHEFLSAPLDCNGDPIFDKSKLDKAWNNGASEVCYWCGGALTEHPKPQPAPETKAAPKPQPTSQPKPQPKPESKPQPKPEPQPKKEKPIEQKPVQPAEKAPEIPEYGVKMIFNNETGTLWIVGNGDLEVHMRGHKKEYKELTGNPKITKIIFKGTISHIWSSSLIGKLFSTKFQLSDFKNLQEVELPEGVTEIPSLSFTNCRNLKKVTLPNSLRKISAGSFGGCESTLSEIVNLHPRVEYSKYVFEDHKLLKGKIPPSQG